MEFLYKKKTNEFYLEIGERNKKKIKNEKQIKYFVILMNFNENENKQKIIKIEKVIFLINKFKIKSRRDFKRKKNYGFNRNKI